MLKKEINQVLNINYFIDLGLHLGNRVQNRAVWLQNFILGSRGSSWDILNIQELLKRLERLGPIIVHIVKNGGTILVMNRSMEKEVYYLSKIFNLRPFSNVVRVFTDDWIDGAFTNFINFKFLNLRQLPSLVFLSDFTGSKNFLDEAYFLRIPVVALVDSREHPDLLMKKVMMPIPANNSIKSLFFFFNYLKFYVEKGLTVSNYSFIRDDLFSHFNGFKSLRNKEMILKSDNSLSDIYKKYNKRKFFYYLDNYIKNISGIEKNTGSVDLDNTKSNLNISKNVYENVDSVKSRHLNLKSLVRLNAKAVYARGFIQRFRGVIKHSNLRFEEKFDIDKHFFTRYNTPINFKRIWKKRKLAQKRQANNLPPLKKSSI